LEGIDEPQRIGNAMADEQAQRVYAALLGDARGRPIRACRAAASGRRDACTRVGLPAPPPAWAARQVSTCPAAFFRLAATGAGTAAGYRADELVVADDAIHALETRLGGAHGFSERTLVQSQPLGLHGESKSDVPPVQRGVGGKWISPSIYANAFAI